MNFHRSLGMFLCGPVLGLAAGLNASAALAGDPGAIPGYAFTPHQNIFVFAGKSVDEKMFESMNLFGADYEDNVLVGLGYQRFFYETMQISLGLEGGLAGRFGDKDSAEFWGGVVGRYDGFVLFDTLKIAPAFTFGLSAITDTMAGREEEKEENKEGDATLLFYLGPEINFSLAGHPNVEMFWRLHHRSGAQGTLGDMTGAVNANVFGVRVDF
jgi:hypothetical protein